MSNKALVSICFIVCFFICLFFSFGITLSVAQDSMDEQNITEEPASYEMPIEDNAVEPQAATELQQEMLPQIQEEPSVQWIWGKIVSCNTQDRKIVISYLDMDTLESVNMELNIDDNAKFEGVSGLSDLKIGDQISIDYVVKNGVKFVQYLGVEKKTAPDDASVDAASAEKSEIISGNETITQTQGE